MASPESLNAALMRAVDLALAGDWDGAHKIVQKDEDDQTSCWIHAVLHKIEGDAANSRYWYGRASHGRASHGPKARTFEDCADPRAEFAAIRGQLAG